MKNILHLIDTTGPGGAETVFIDLIRSLDPKQYRSVVLITGPGWVKETLESHGITPYVFPAKGSFNLAYLQHILSLIKKHDIDLIQSHLMGACVYGGIAGWLARKPVFGTLHGFVDVKSGERFLRLKYFLVNRLLRNVVMVSHRLKCHFADTGMLTEEKLKVIYNGVDTQCFVPMDTNANTRVNAKMSALRQELGLDPEQIIVGSVGNIREPKGYDHLLRAAALLKDKTVHFVIAGQGKGRLLDDLLALRSSLGLEDRVHFLGFRADTDAILQQIDIFLLSSTTEGFSIATIEAMAAGCPVIATRSGGPEEIIQPDENGVLVPAADPEAIAAAVSRLADLQNEALREDLAKAGRATVEQRFSLRAMVKAYEELYS